MQIKFEGDINTDVELNVVFKAFKQFMVENLQNYRFSMSDSNETLKHEYHRPKEEPTPEPEPIKEKETTQVVIG